MNAGARPAAVLGAQISQDNICLGFVWRIVRPEASAAHADRLDRRHRQQSFAAAGHAVATFAAAAKGQARMTFTAEISATSQLQKALSAICEVTGILEARRA